MSYPMKRLRPFVTSILPVCLVLMALPTFAQEKRTENQMHRVYDVSGIKTLQIKSEYPVRVTFVGSSGDSLLIDRLLDKKIRVDYSVSRDNGTLILTFHETANQKQRISREERETWIDHLLNGDWNKNHYREGEQNEFRITLPENLDLELNTSDSHLELHQLQGSISASGSNNHLEIDSLGKDLKIDGSDQRIKGNGINGTVTIDNHDGSVNLRSVNGPVSIRSDNSQIYLEDIRNSVALSVSDGSGNLRNIQRKVTLNGDNSRFQVNESRGIVTLSGHDNHLNASDIEGFQFDGSDAQLSVDHVNNTGVTITNSNGSVKLDEIQGPAKIKGSDLNVTLNYIHHLTSLNLDDSHVSGYKLMGNTSLRGNNTSVDLDEYQAHSFMADGGSGDINLSMSSRVDSVSIRRRSGDITIHLLESYSGGYHLRAQRGHISWAGKQGLNIRQNGDEMEVSGGNNKKGSIHIELGKGNIRIN